MSKFSRWTPTLGVCFKWDSQKVLKIAHFGVFRHIGGTWGVQKHMYLKIYWVKVISSKNGDFWTPQCWEINFFRQNICMFDWLYTETYSTWKAHVHINQRIPTPVSKELLSEDILRMAHTVHSVPLSIFRAQGPPDSLLSSCDPPFWCHGFLCHGDIQIL